MRSLLVPLCLLIGLVAVAPARAQIEGEESEQEGAYFETVDVNLVNVEVFVTDKKGRPISGLTRDDFEIFEDGRPVPISNFVAFESGESVSSAQEPAAGESSAPSPPPPAPAVAETVGVPEDQQLHLVVYVDNFNIRPFNRNRVFRRLREFLNDELSRQDRVMLISYDRSLHLRHPFTSDPQLIASALFELEELTGHAVHLDSDRRDLLREIDEAENLLDVEWRVTQLAQSMFNDLSFSIDAMKEIIKSLGGLPGRKAFLYVSDGVPMVPAEDLFYALSNKFRETTVLTRAREFDASRRFREVAFSANSSRVTFYAIDAAGLRAPAVSDVSIETPGAAGLVGFIDTINIQNLQAPLEMMAELTGGSVIKNTNDVGPGLARIASDFNTFYSLGYTPAHSGTGRYYKIGVKVKGKGLRVRHREGYRDRPLLDRLTDVTTSSLMYGYESNPLGIKVRLAQGSAVEGSLFDIQVAVAIPLDNIVLVPLEEVHQARVRLFFSAMDEDGDFSPVQQLNLPISIPKDQIEESRGKAYVHRDTLRMRAGSHRLAVGIWDEIGATSSFVTQAIVVGSG